MEAIGNKAEMKAKPIEEMVTERTQQWQKRKNGTVIPAKRRSVKKLMCGVIVGYIADKGSKVASGSKNPKKNFVTVHPAPHSSMMM